MTQVFISYSRRDITFVERLAKDLRRAGFEIWYDLSGLEAGKNWGIEIQDALEKSQFLVVILSPNSLKSRWVEREYLFAESLNLKVVPVLYEPCRLPLWTIDLHYVDMTSGTYRKRLEELLRVLGKPEKPAREVPTAPVAAAQSEPTRAETVPQKVKEEQKPAAVFAEPKEELEIQPVKPEPVKLEALPEVAPLERELKTAPSTIEDVRPPVESPVQIVQPETPKIEPAMEPTGELVKEPAEPPPEVARPVEIEVENVTGQKPPVEAGRKAGKPKPSASRKLSLGVFAAGGVVLLVLAVLLTGWQLGWFTTGKPAQAPAGTAPATLTAATSTAPAPTATAYVMPGAEAARAFADPLLQWVSEESPLWDEDFSQEQHYWARLMRVNGYVADLAELAQDGTLHLQNKYFSNYHLGINELYEDWKWMKNAFVFQYDFKLIGPNKGLKIEHNISGNNRTLQVSYDSLGLHVYMWDDSTGQIIATLAADPKVDFSPDQWHTLQLIAFDQDLAVYLDGNPVYYGQDVDPRPEGTGISVYIVPQQSIDMELDNFKLWDLSSSYAAIPFADPIRQWAATSEPSASEDFSSTPDYWEEFVTYFIVDQRYGPDVLPEGGELVLRSEDPAKSYQLELASFDIFPANNFVLQFDFKPGEGDQSGFNIAFRQPRVERVAMGLNIDGDLWVSKLTEPDGATIEEYGRKSNLDIAPSQWHTFQYIFADRTLAVYLDDRPVFYVENVDFGMVEDFFISFSGDRLELALDNFQVWTNYQVISSIDGMALVYVPTGTFTMGKNTTRADYSPEHEVQISGFWIDSTEVTNAMYAQCVADHVCDLPYALASSTHADYYANPTYAGYPVVNVSWTMAKSYCEWAGRRLPTEAEWEKAARGTDGRIYPWGNQLEGEIPANLDGQDLVRVASYENGRSPYGAYDMVGNAWEWVMDWYDSNYYQDSPAVDPQGPLQGENEYRIMKGGSFHDGLVWGYVYIRNPGGDHFYDNSSGFRCAVSGAK